ncbi:MAG: DUF1858 domain-containing protein [Chloroflexota bacterium]|nr:DUF1858 domain-containing protein [Chloroflexota bacterium]MDE3101567.1 DUF1858 domain-containing protein [Chloroflexota bacterium]
MKLAPSATVAEVMGKRPGAMRVFLRYGMHCPICDLASFETVADAAAAYGLDPRRLLREIERETSTK